MVSKKLKLIGELMVGHQKHKLIPTKAKQESINLPV